MGPDRLRYVDPFNLYDLSKPTTLPPSSDSPSKRPSEDTLPPPVTNTPRPVRPSRVQIALYCFLCFIWVACLNIFLVPYLFPYTPNPVINTDIASRLGYKQIEDIPAKFIPGIHDTENKRLVFIGDVHGMYTELRALLKKIDYNEKTDHLVFTGDLVTKGPDSLKVINYARRQGASCVRGNQDDKVLLHYHSYHKKNASAREDDNEEAPVSATEKKLRTEKALSKKMTAKEAEWLDSCPLILRARDVKGLGNVAVVHAGLVQGVPLSKQDPFAVMNMRSINTKSGIPSETREWTHWARFWNKQERAAHSPITVVYGHYAAKGLDLRPLTKGLDSNCVRGGKLTAMIASTGSKRPHIVSVKCRSEYD